MTRDGACDLLGLPTESPDGPLWSVTAVRAAWANAVRAVHPDHGGTGDAESLGMLTMARDILLQTEPQACKQCAGVGKVRMRFGMVQCSGCKGTGDRNG